MWLLLLLRRIANPRRAPRSRLTDGIAALVIGILLVVNIVRLGGDDDSWRRGEGPEMKAGFIAGCEDAPGNFVDCGCAFEQLTSTPPYDTPEGFLTLHEGIETAQRSQDPRDVPAPLMTAFRSCLLSTS